MEKTYYEHKCPCGNKIEIKAQHKYSGVPKACKSGHTGLAKDYCDKNNLLFSVWTEKNLKGGN